MKSKKFDKYLLLSWKRVLILVVAWFVSVVVHNLGSALLTYLLGYEFEEAVFFIIAVIVIPFYFLVGLIYSFLWWLRKV
jgi:hypothetical protein